MTLSKIISFMGLIKKANKLSLGNDAVISSIKSGKSKLVLVSCDFSKNSETKFKKLCDDYNTPFFKLNASMCQIESILGKKCGIFSVNDIGFSSKMINLICCDNEEEDNL